jgi:RimJ/RimL family protein N-acetyltransferase
MICNLLGERIRKVTLLLLFNSNFWKECTFIVLSSLHESESEIDRMIGDVNVFLNDDDDSRVELDIMIAEPNFRARGCGKEAVLLMMWYCIHHLRISKFYCKINESNLSSLGLFRRCFLILLSLTDRQTWIHRGKICQSISRI